jgi:hypothetical protein
MYVDNNLLVSGAVSALGVITGQTVTGASVTVLSTNTIDLLQNRDIAAGNDWLKMRMQTLVAQVGATSIDAQIIVADDAGLTTNVTQIGSTGALLTAAMTLGSRFTAELNTRLLSKGQRYLGVRYVIVGTSTAGAFFTDFGPDLEDFKAYPSGFAVI